MSNATSKNNRYDAALAQSRLFRPPLPRVGSSSWFVEGGPAFVLIIASAQRRSLRGENEQRHTANHRYDAALVQ